MSSRILLPEASLRLGTTVEVVFRLGNGSNSHSPRWMRAGHEAVLQDTGRDYLGLHVYGAANARPFLNNPTVEREDGRPKVAALP